MTPLRSWTRSGASRPRSSPGAAVVSDRDRARGGRRRPDRRVRARQSVRRGFPRPRATRKALRPTSSRASSGTIPIRIPSGASKAPTTSISSHRAGAGRAVPRLDAARVVDGPRAPRTRGAYLAMTVGADVRDRLAAIRARTLVLHSQRESFRAPPPRPLRRVGHRGCAVRARAGCRPRAVDGVLRRSARRDRGVPDRAPARVRGPGADDGALHRPRRLDPTRGRDRRRGLACANWTRTTRSCGRSSAASAGGRSTRRATASSRRSMHRRARCRAAIAIIEAARAAGFAVRAGIHTGECERRGDDLAGLAVHIAARVGAEAGAGEVLVSRTVSDIVAGSGLVLESRGEYELKGVPSAGSCSRSSPESGGTGPYNRDDVRGSRAVLARAHRLPAHRQRAHGAVQLAVRAPHGRHVHPAHRGHRRGPLDAGGGRPDPAGAAVARPRLGRRPVPAEPSLRDVSRRGRPPARAGRRVRVLLHRGRGQAAQRRRDRRPAARPGYDGRCRDLTAGTSATRCGPTAGRGRSGSARPTRAAARSTTSSAARCRSTGRRSPTS